MTEVLDTYRNNPVGFVQEVLGDMPYSKQREVLEKLALKRRVSVVGANGSGKDWAAARAVLWWLATRLRAVVVVTGPTQRQVDEIVWRELRSAYKASRVPLGGRVTGSHWNIDDDRFAIGFSTNRPDNLQGFHSPELLVVVTEAHAVPQDQMEALKRLNPTRMLLTGNAFSRDGEFFDSHHTKRNLYTCVAISAFDTPNFTGENGGIPGTPTEEDIEERKLDWGEDHPLYQGSVLGRFPDMLDDSLIARSAIEAAVERWEHATRHSRTGGNPECAGSAPGAEHGAGCDCGDQGERGLPATLDSSLRWKDEGDPRHSRTGGDPECAGSAPGAGHGAGCDCGDQDERGLPATLDSSLRWKDGRGGDPSCTSCASMLNAPRRLGVDVARFGSDKTALCVRRGWFVESLRSFARIDTMRTAGEASVLVRDQEIPAVFVDEGGLGGGVVDRLRELGAPVYGVQFGGKARQSGRFANMRAELFWELRRLFNEGLIAIPPDEELIGQLLGLRYDVTSAGQVRMESKSALRRRGLRSPDKADALALAFMEPPSLRIWTGYEPGVAPAEAPPVRDSTSEPSTSLTGNLGIW